MTGITAARETSKWIRRIHETSHNVSPPGNNALLEKPLARRLPLQCTGCGAFSQTKVAGEAGYFDLNRIAVREYLGLLAPQEAVDVEEQEDRVVQETLQRLSPEELGRLGLAPEDLFMDKSRRVTQPEASAGKVPPVCERCHNLLHHNKGVPIYHPNVGALREIISESPHKYNHVYHLVDAADFPLSLVPRLHEHIGDIYLRAQNRRSRTTGRFYGNRMMEMSFVITRSDLLAPTKEMVDSLLPYMREVLRKALGSAGRRVRLGNVTMVSADRGWWTRPLREEIFRRGGGAWMVGKVNVGKSKLFETAFPKGQFKVKRPELQNQDGLALPEAESDSSATEPKQGALPGSGQADSNPAIEEAEGLDLECMLPPPRAETDYPFMPTVASLPGTTASPIRVPFGKGKGELIDLPGLARSDLETFVQEKHRSSLLMKHRIAPEQIVIKPDQSLLLGGFIRITPKTPNLIFLAANFTPLEDHLTGTHKAIDIQKQDTALHVENISIPGTGEKVKSAGSFALMHDITRHRAGPLTRRDAIGLKPERMPFRVLALDILIEGVGWVEIAAQVRTRDYPHDTPKLKGEHIKESEYKSERIQSPKHNVEDSGKTEAKPEDPWEAIELAADPTANARDFAKTNIKTGNLRKMAEPAPALKAADEGTPTPTWPIVEVFTPEGRFVGSRVPMNSYMMNKAKVKKAPRVRRSVKGQKKKEKMLRRREQSAQQAA